MEDRRIDSSYLYRVFAPEDYTKLIDEAVENIKLFEAQTPFDAIAFTGMSGSAIAYPLSYILKKPLLCVRKPEITAHSSRSVEGVVSAKSYIIVDDCIDSGATVDRIRKSVSESYYTKDCKLVGIYLFHPMDDCNRRWQKRSPENEAVKIIHKAFTDANW